MNIEAKIKKDVDLKKLTTFQIGGKAKFFLEISKKEELPVALAWAKKNKKKIFILGGGSNVLVSDLGIDGLVLKVSNNDIEVKGERLELGAGASLAKTVSTATANNLSGLAWAAGIPGTVGGAIRGNAGAYGSRMSDIVETVELYDFSKDKFDLLSRNLCKFKYRHSIFKTNKALLVWSIVLKLKPGNKEEIIQDINSHLEHRQKALPCLPSAGCVFKNFKIEEIEAVNPKLAEDAHNSGAVKGGMVGSGWVIDQADLRGKKMGNVKLSLEHANFIVNTGNASADEVIMMSSYIKQQVRDEFGLQLSEEVEYFGF